MDRYITATEANQRFSEMLREVGKGESYTVTSRGKPVARMVPAEEDAKPKGLSTMFDEMNKLPGLVSGPWKREDLYDR
jgi:prevent-host-death family protein